MIRILLMGCLVLGISSCSINGEPIFKDGESGNVSIFEPTNDTAQLSHLVRQALRNNAQTAQERIQVSSPNDDSITLSGFVSNDAVRYEAERVANNVSGVRFVLNNLDVSSF